MHFVRFLSVFAIPTVIFTIVISGLIKGEKVFDAFIEGARDGLNTVIKIFPPLIGLMVAVAVFRASGALDLVIYAASPVLHLLGIPSEVMPLVIMRPVSGSASLAIVSDMLKRYGADTLIGMTACTIMGSTETIFYTLTLYFGSIGIKKIRYAFAAAIIAEIVGVIASSWACRMLLL